MVSAGVFERRSRESVCARKKQRGVSVEIKRKERTRVCVRISRRRRRDQHQNPRIHPTKHRISSSCAHCLPLGSLPTCVHPPPPACFPQTLRTTYSHKSRRTQQRKFEGREDRAPQPPDAWPWRGSCAAPYWWLNVNKACMHLCIHAAAKSHLHLRVRHAPRP